MQRFGEKAAKVLIVEWKQLDKNNVFHGLYFKDTVPDQFKNALQLVQLKKQKRRGKIKGRT